LESHTAMFTISTDDLRQLIWRLPNVTENGDSTEIVLLMKLFIEPIV